jgi:hypothetical protein
MNNKDRTICSCSVCGSHNIVYLCIVYLCDTYNEHNKTTTMQLQV